MQLIEASRRMPGRTNTVAWRCRHLRESLGYTSQTAFADVLGITLARWNNVENGLPLSSQLALIVVKRFPGVSMDWLFTGGAYGLSFEMARLLGVHPTPPGKRTNSDF